VQHREDPSERLAIVRPGPQGWSLPRFLLGQYAMLGPPDPERARGMLRRLYSSASAPVADHLECYIQLV
jgi:ferredoxin-NADP reductase